LDECVEVPIVDLPINVQQPSVSAADLLALMPEGLVYLFLDEILEVDRTHIVARYRFREDEFFYPGHFPDRPVTPGTILLEAMCQCGMTAQSLYLLSLEFGIENARKHRILFTSSEVEWFDLVAPGTVIQMRGQVLGWKRKRIHARVQMFDEKGSLVAESKVSGVGVIWDSGASTAKLISSRKKA
jgi:3-hydroxyacyl-[acyl-carrier-protein] dehydratase